MNTGPTLTRRNVLTTLAATLGGGLAAPLFAQTQSAPKPALPVTPKPSFPKPTLHVYSDYGWLRGFNYIMPWGTRIEDTWWFYDGGKIREDMALARSVHANAIRLWIDYSVWYRDPEKVMASFLDAIAAIAENGMKAMPCLFNRWVGGRHDYGGTHTENIRPNMPEQLDYVRALVTPLANDPRYGFDFCTDKPDRSQPYRDTKHFTNDAIRFIRDNRQQSFFLYVPYVAVHGGHVVPPEDQARWQERLKGKKDIIAPEMLASLEFVDRSVGRILDALDELKLADNTIVIFASDNGGVGKDLYSEENAPFRLGKGTLYEGGVRVPLFIRWPGKIQPGSRCDAPVHFADMLPTLCDAAGVKPDPAHKLDGTNLRPVFSGGTLPERTLSVTYPHYLAEHGTTPVRAAIQGRYKLVWHPHDHIEIAGARVTESTIRYVPQPRTEFFDMESDPSEHENLADKYPDKGSELKSLLETWMKETGAKALTPNPAYDATRPLFNTRDEWLQQEREKKEAKK